MTSFLKSLFLAAVLLLGSSGASHGAVRGLDPDVALQAWELLHNMEIEHNIPQGLLHAISLMETGGGMDGQMVPWPYAINVNTGSWQEGLPQDMALQVGYLENLGFKEFTIRKPSTARKTDLSATEAKSLLKTMDPDLPVAIRGERFSKRFSNKWQAVFFVNRLLVAGHDNVDVGLMQVNWMYHGQNFTDLAEAFDPYHNVKYAVSYLLRHREKHDWWGSVGRYHSGTKHHAERYIKGVWGMYQKVHRLAAHSG